MNMEEIRATAIKVAAEITAPMFPNDVDMGESVIDSEQYLFILADDITKYILTGRNKHLLL